MFCWLGDMLDEVTAIVEGYSAYFSFSKVKTGYSGELKCTNKHRSETRYCNQGSTEFKRNAVQLYRKKKHRKRNSRMFFGTVLNYAPINSKLQHPPPHSCKARAFELLKIGSFKFPPPWAKVVSKCPTPIIRFVF